MSWSLLEEGYDARLKSCSLASNATAGDDRKAPLAKRKNAMTETLQKLAMIYVCE